MDPDTQQLTPEEILSDEPHEALDAPADAEVGNVPAPEDSDAAAG